MTVHLEPTTSIWMHTGEIPSNGPLTANVEADVCIIGAGLAGLTTAYLLMQEGRSVVVVDDGPIGGGQTERTTAHLSNAIDERYMRIESLHGREGARRVAESHSAAINLIESIVMRHNIDCEFERLDGYLFNHPGESTRFLEQERDAARRAGLSIELVPRCPLTMFDAGPCLRFPRQGQIHPRKYLAGLTDVILHRGGRIFTQTHVDGIECGPPATVRTYQGPTVRSGSVVVATNTPFNDWVTIHTKQSAYMTYVLAFAVPRGVVNRALYWDTATPYHYVRLQAIPDHDSQWDQLGDPHSEELLIVGGEDHKTGQADDAEERYARLEAWTHLRFPVRGGSRSRWSGQVFQTIDGLAHIGRNPLDGPNVFIATGDCGQGMTHGTIAGILITDLIMARHSPWAELYDPARKTLRAGQRFLKENLNVGVQYSAWVTGGDVDRVEDIQVGQGAVVRRGLSKIAAYRDESGKLHECSAVCPHLNCIVEWNHFESSWDCPCHGSRFDKEGHVLMGPANTDLAPIHES